MGKAYSKEQPVTRTETVNLGVVEYCYLREISQPMYTKKGEEDIWVLTCPVILDLFDAEKNLLDSIPSNVAKEYDHLPTVEDRINLINQEVKDFIDLSKSNYAGYVINL